VWTRRRGIRLGLIRWTSSYPDCPFKSSAAPQRHRLRGEVTITPPPVPATFRCHWGTRHFSWVTASVPDYICLPSGTGFKFTLFTRRLPCSTTPIRKSLPTTSAPTRLRWHDSRHLAALPDASTVWGKVQGLRPRTRW